MRFETKLYLRIFVLSIDITITPLENVLIIKPKRFEDIRGFFEESWNAKSFSENGIDMNFIQDNHSYSKEQGTLRGLHYQKPPYAQDKLIRCSQGSIFDVAVDIRQDSSTYGKWFGMKLSRDNGMQLLIPKGFLHGFLTLEPDTEVQYKCSNYYFPEFEGAVLWNSLDINWPLFKNSPPILSSRDINAELFENLNSPFKLDSN